jgi:hypothetical protein
MEVVGSGQPLGDDPGPSEGGPDGGRRPAAPRRARRGGITFHHPRPFWAGSAAATVAVLLRCSSSPQDALSVTPLLHAPNPESVLCEVLARGTQTEVLSLPAGDLRPTGP